MIGPPDIDNAFKTALELVEMISDISSEIGKLPIFPLNHPVFFITEIG